jgi:hypothetical protein
MVLATDHKILAPTTHCHSWQLSSKHPNQYQQGPNTRITSVTLRFIVFTGMLSAQMWRLMELQCNRKWMICAPAVAGLHASSHVLVCASLTPHPPSWVHHPTERKTNHRCEQIGISRRLSLRRGESVFSHNTTIFTTG